MLAIPPLPIEVDRSALKEADQIKCKTENDTEHERRIDNSPDGGTWEQSKIKQENRDFDERELREVQ